MPDADKIETNLVDFSNGITTFQARERQGEAEYKSANTDVLTRIIGACAAKTLIEMIEDIADASG